MLGQAFDLLEREEPRAQLEAALADARRGHGSIVSVEGEAGIGKTALALSFIQSHRDDARVYVGGCEHLATPEPLGPLRDIARDSQGRFSISTSGPLATYESLLRLLNSGRGPALLVVEDIHWADDGTLDMIRYLGRRIAGAPAVAVVTARDEATASRERLASLWTDIPRDARRRVQLQPLSLDAVRTLAGPSSGLAAQDVYATTGGNPFHVTEFLASGGEAVPRSVQDATLARAGQLGSKARRVLDWAAIFPRQIDEAALRSLADDEDSAGAEECLRVGMLQARGGALAFRHELARRAVLDAIAPLRRRELHAAALDRLKHAGDGRAAEIAHHAEEAGAQDDLVRYSIIAADEAVELGAHREAVSHLASALAHGETLPDATCAKLLIQQAEAGERCGAFHVAVPAIDEAIAISRRIGDPLGLGDALRIASRLRWFYGESDRADADAAEAVKVLEAFPDSWQYAIALSAQSQLDMLVGRVDAAIQRGSEAMDRAKLLGRTDIYFHALTNVCGARCSRVAQTGIADLEAAIAEARALGELEAVPRLYSNLTFVKANARRYEGLFKDCQDGIDAALARDNAPIEAYIRGAKAGALLDLGRPVEALHEAESVIEGPYPRRTTIFPALMVASRARVRLGLPEGGAADEGRALDAAHRDLMRVAPLAVADAEAVWLGVREIDAVGELRTAYRLILEAWGQIWTLGEVAMWLSILGETVSLPTGQQGEVSEAHRAMIDRDWPAAARAWAAQGCPFEQAIALSFGDETEQRQALTLFEQHGYAPAARKLRRQMREKGVKGVPAGPRTARRNDPLGLTPRQRQVLDLLAEGLSNAEIADRLEASPKTVEHHVGAVLAALDAPSRLRAVQIARERGLIED